LAIFLLIAAAGQINTQRSEFVEYLLQLQYIADPLHDYITNYFAEARAELSDLLTGLNDEGVLEVTSGLRAVIDLRDRTEEIIAEATTENNGECIAEATATWPAALESVGAEISRCAEEFVGPVYELTEEIHLFIQSNNYKAFNAQNMVLNHFTQINPLTQADQLTPETERQIDEVFENFEIEVKPYIQRYLFDVNTLRTTVPDAINVCIDEALVQFGELAIPIIEAVEAC